MRGLPLKRLFVLGIRNILRNKRRSVLTILSVLIGAASCLVLAALARGMGKQLIDDAIYNLTGHIQIHAAGYLDDPAVEFVMRPASEKLRSALSHPKVEAWAERIRFPAITANATRRPGARRESGWRACLKTRPGDLA